MKSLASSFFVRSAGIAKMVRPVCAAISAAAASSGARRRAQMATSTPSRASASVMPRPMPSLPPVTNAVLPLSSRSTVTSLHSAAQPLTRCKHAGCFAIARHGSWRAHAMSPAATVGPPWCHLCANNSLEQAESRRNARRGAIGPVNGGRSRLEPPGRSPHGLDCCVRCVRKCEDPARTTFQAVIAPRERSHETAFAEHQLDVPADILGVKQTFLEGKIVERKHVGHDASAGTLVNILEAAKELFRRPAVLPRELRGDVGSHLA